MTGESLHFNCQSCAALIVLSGGVRNTAGPKDGRYQDRENPKTASVHEGLCPKCDHPFEIWSDPRIETTHVVDLEVHRPEIFSGGASKRVTELRAQREEAETRREESRLAGEKLRNEREAKRQAELADKQKRAQEARKAKRASRTDDDDGDWYDDDDGGRTPNDDRSDSMNPNNDAYWGSRQ